MTILNIETSTSCCSASITVDGKPLVVKENTCGANHAHDLPLFIDDLLRYAREHGLHIEAVALSEGPGSYTGLRIGASTAKGICYGLNVPLIPIDTLQLLCKAAAQAVVEHDGDGSILLCPMIDARRMEVYTAMYEPCTLQRIGEIEAKVIDGYSFAQQLDQSDAIWFFGDGAAKCKPLIQHKNAHFIDNIVPSAQWMGELAERETARRLDVKQMAYFEPFYLKDFIPAPSHVKGLQ